MTSAHSRSLKHLEIFHHTIFTIANAITNGVTKDELRAIIHVIGIYCGVPQALECFRVAKKVLAEAENAG